MAEPATPVHRRPRNGRARQPGIGAHDPGADARAADRSRLTPNTISLTGFVLDVAAAGLIVERMFLPRRNHLHRRLGHGHPRRSLLAHVRQGDSLRRAFLDSTLDRLEEGIVLIAVAAYFASLHNQVAVAAVVLAVLGSLMVSLHRARARGPGRRLQGRPRDPPGPGRDPLDRARVRQGRLDRALRAPRAAGLRLGGPLDFTMIQRILYVRKPNVLLTCRA